MVGFHTVEDERGRAAPRKRRRDAPEAVGDGRRAVAGRRGGRRVARSSDVRARGLEVFGRLPELGKEVRGVRDRDVPRGLCRRRRARAPLGVGPRAVELGRRRRRRRERELGVALRGL